jgi:hypothetical protein
MRRAFLSVSVILLSFAGTNGPARAQDSTGVHLASIPDGLPKKEAERLAKQRKLVATAVDSIDAAIHRFNLRCAAVATAAALAACQAEMTELQTGGAQLEQLKTAFNDDLKKTSAKFPHAAPAAAKPAAPENPAVEERGAPVQQKTRKPIGIKGGGSAMDQARGAKAAGERATMGKNADKALAGEVFDTPGETAPNGIEGGERKPLIVPESLRKNPEFMKLEDQRIKLEKERKVLFEKLAKSKGDGKHETALKIKLTKNDQDAVWIRYKQEELIKARSR